MDQLKVYLQQFKKHQFWFFSAALLITGIVVWYQGTNELQAKYQKDKQLNDFAFNTVRPYMQGNPPNAKFKDLVEGRRVNVEGEVVDAHKNLFQRQMRVLNVNPKVGELGKYLIDEKFIGKDIPLPLRDTYHNNQVIDNDFRDLFSELNLRRPVGTNPVDEAPVDAKAVPEGLVVWNVATSPRKLMQRYKTTKTPSTVRIRMTQEDLWVFRSMFSVVKQVNQRPIEEWLTVLDGGQPQDAAVDQANVPIKQINYCDVAQYAMSSAFDRPGRTTDFGEKTGVPGAGAAGFGGGFSVNTVGTEEEDRKLQEGRYVDGRNLPVPDPKAPPFTEFKQVFVQMSVVMDQRLIPLLISEFSNAPLPIETRQVLVDLKDVDVIRSVNSGEAARTINRIEQSPHDVQVTIRGIVYGYSPPDKAILGKGSDPDPSKRDYGIPYKPKETTAF